MASLPVYSGKEVVRIFGKAGWQLARQPYDPGKGRQHRDLVGARSP
jgi:predicted RNA binding protein YcfA (HicA-like mRNA interferase family)